MNDVFDIHNHILPGVDDGSSCLEESTLLIDKEYEQGVRNLILTPHLRPDMFEVSPEERVEVYEGLLSAVKDLHPDMNIYLGCEVYLNKKTVDCFANSANRMLGLSVVLVEFNYGVTFSTMVELLRKVQDQGYSIIIAHVERYDCLRENINNISILKSMGCYLQVNCDAVIGKNGFMTKLYVDKLFRKHSVDFVASDAHDIKRRVVHMDKACRLVEKKYGLDIAQAVFRDNAEALFGKKG
ncbi:MAG: hypothetical protein MJ094_06925 [Saccharofermentans sp.]|nr:hypothetical protein [Saccharofermentans sp.]